MGFQVVEAGPSYTYSTQKFIVFNAEIAIEIGSEFINSIREIRNSGLQYFKTNSRLFDLNIKNVLTESQFRNMVSEPGGKGFGATDGPFENASGVEVFVRLSAYENDKRIDFVNMCLRPGSFTTTLEDYLRSKTSNDDPIERYALPNHEIIKWAFHIKPINTDVLQRGTVQPANNKRGGGKEVYFKNGTSQNTLSNKTSY